MASNKNYIDIINEPIIIIIFRFQCLLLTEFLHIGHLSDFYSQGYMHYGWKLWEHGKTMIFYPCFMESWHTEHISSLFFDVFIYKFLIYSLFNP